MTSIRDNASKRDHAVDGQEVEDAIKKQKLEGEAKPEPRDPGKKDYGEMRKVLRQLTDATSIPECDENVLERIRIDIENLAKLVAFKTTFGETLNPHKLLQMNLKCILFSSKDDVHNIKNFLTGLEDSSACKSDRDNSIYMFLANQATELWYQWKEDLGQWQWTPEANGSVWMPCTTHVRWDVTEYGDLSGMQFSVGAEMEAYGNRAQVTGNQFCCKSWGREARSLTPTDTIGKVSDGQWQGEDPALENVDIINYLNAIRPLPCDEQYLSSSYDVIQLLCKLKDMGDEKITEKVKKIATEVVALEGNEEVPTNITVVKELMNKFRALLDQPSDNDEREDGSNDEREDENNK